MKRWLILVLFILFANYAYAGDVHYLDFSEEKVIILTMAERDVARFMFPVRDYFKPYLKDGREQIEFEEREKEQVFMLRETQHQLNKTLADVTFFIEGAETPQYATLMKKTSLKMDFDRDSVNDMEIRVLDFAEDSDNVTFEFVVSDKINAEYKPTHFVNRTDTNSNINSSSGNNLDIIGYLRNIANKSYKNWEISILIVIVVLLMVWNKRPIERFLRRNF